METSMLEDIFKMQLELNDYVFKNNNLKNNLGDNLSMQAIMSAVDNKEIMVNDLPNKWLVNYSKAMKEELYELEDELLWKWWSKDEIDMQNIRVELIDILHFLVSAMMCAGLTAEKVFDIYKQKHSVNIKRQDTDYNKKNKTEDDNQEIN